MTRFAVTVLALVLSWGCGSARHWIELAPGAMGGGMEVKAAGIQVWEQDRPYLPTTRRCVTYTVLARSTDGGRHELRAGDFRTDHGRPLDALGPCGRPQLDPVWLSPTFRSLPVTVLTSAPRPEPLWVDL